MKVKHIANIASGQDGAIWGNYLFRFNSKGLCRVYDISGLKPSENIGELTPMAEFVLGSSELIVPHSNAVMFGTEYYDPADEFPLLYSNIYNNYAKEENPLVGVCCVYRLRREADSFAADLVQLIEIGFTDNREYWRSPGDVADVRPYGNFVIDHDAGLYWGFVMRDGCDATRYIAFDIPKLNDGIQDPKYGVNKVTLGIGDIRDSFDCDYHHYVQGGCCHKGIIYSVEGFTRSEKNPPAIRVIDTRNHIQYCHYAFGDFDMTIEPEFIDFWGEQCIYSDAHGNVYALEF